MVRNAVRTWHSIEELWSWPWFGYILVAVAVGLLSWWYFHVPPPGYSITLMAVVAGLVVFRADMSGREKWLWAVILIAFAVLEIRAVNRDRYEHDQQQTRFLEEEQKDFATIGRGIQGAIRESDKHFQATMGQTRAVLHSGEDNERIATSALEEMTGVNSYIYFEGTEPSGPIQLAAPGIVKGSMISYG